MAAGQNCRASAVKAATTIIHDWAPLIVVPGTSRNAVPPESSISCNKTSRSSQTTTSIAPFKENPPLDLCLFPAEQQQKICFQTGAVEYLSHDDIAVLLVQSVFILLPSNPPPPPPPPAFSGQNPVDELQWVPSKQAPVVTRYCICFPCDESFNGIRRQN